MSAGRWARGVVVTATVAALVGLVPSGAGIAGAVGGSTVRVSVSSSGTPANDLSEVPSVSTDGRFVAFDSTATNLVPDDLNGSTADVFVRDRVAGTTELVSVATSGEAGDENSSLPAISGNGRVVVWASPATTFDPQADGCTTGGRHPQPCYQVYARDRVAGTTVLVGATINGDTSDGVSADTYGVSADGRYVVFTSAATNLVPGDTNGRSDAFVRDLQAATTSRISVDALGGQSTGSALDPAISADGSTVAFTSTDPNLAPGGYSAGTIYVADRVTHAIEARGLGDATPGGSFGVALNGDGRIVAYSTQDALLPADQNPSWDVYLEDRVTNARELVDVSMTAAVPIYADRPSISADGRFVAFRSGSALTTDATDGNGHVFVRDRLQATTELASVTSRGKEIHNADTGWGALSGDGRFVGIWSADPDVVADDTNYSWDVFVHDRGAPQESASGTGTADTDTEADGANYLDPVETSVAGPAASAITITEAEPTQPLPSGVAPAGQEAAVSVNPAGTVSAPIIVAMRFDASLVPVGGDASSLHLFRDGAEVPDCTAAPTATPDPCVSDRTGLADGDVLLTALASEGGVWTAGTRAPVVDSVTETVAAGNPVSTHPAGGQTVDDLQGTTVVSPTDGTVTIAESPTSATPPGGYSYLGQQVEITAPAGTTTNPLQLSFFVDVSVLPAGESAATLQVFRDGVPIAGCSGPAGEASPDPCVSARSSDGVGDVTITVLSSHASRWNLGTVLPVVTPGLAGVTEGNAGTVTVNVPVTLSKAVATPVSVHYATLDTGGAGIAKPGLDYDATTGTVTFAPGETAKTVAVIVHGDTIDEPPALYGEWVPVAFSGPVGASIDARFFGLGIGIIVDDDPPPVITPGIGGVAEGNAGTRTLDVPVTLSNPSAVPVTVHYTTSNSSQSGVANSPGDYVATSGTLTFAPGETAKTVSITVKGDTLKEPPLLYGEWILVTFANPSASATLDPRFFGLGIGIIFDDD